MNFYRLKDAISMPLGMLRAKINPVRYFKSISLRMHSKVTIYGSSHHFAVRPQCVITCYEVRRLFQAAPCWTRPYGETHLARKI